MNAKTPKQRNALPPRQKDQPETQ